MQLGLPQCDGYLREVTFGWSDLLVPLLWPVVKGLRSPGAFGECESEEHSYGNTEAYANGDVVKDDAQASANASSDSDASAYHLVVRTRRLSVHEFSESAEGF
nr:putative integron gene cassette protein [uncultured bacterium]